MRTRKQAYAYVYASYAYAYALCIRPDTHPHADAYMRMCTYKSSLIPADLLTVIFPRFFFYTYSDDEEKFRTLWNDLITYERYTYEGVYVMRMLCIRMGPYAYALISHSLE